MVINIKVSKINSGTISQTQIYNVMTAKMRVISNQDHQRAEFIPNVNHHEIQGFYAT